MGPASDMIEVKKRLARVRAEMDEVLKDARVVALAAHRKGYSISAIAQSLGVTRQTIYNFLNEEKS